MKKLLLALVALCVGTALLAQDKVNISGSVFDQVTEEPIEYASIRILSAKDSTYITGTATSTKGTFNLGLAPSKYILHISYMGYINHYEDISAFKTHKLNDIYLTENSILLSEAVVEAKAVEIQVKGDTIEYNADSYKVQENAVVEDLLKKMPGVEIDENGKITVNGKEIKKMLIDGKEFFTDDPKVASKNLPAQMVDKLQVVDRKSEMAQLTGFDDDEEETVINLTIKKGMKEGVFGNGFLGGGSKDRYEGNGIVNYMRDNKQMTALGGVNNTNNAGFSDLASSMGESAGPPRGVRFGGNNGISKSTSGGFNMAMDVSAKFKWNGDLSYGGTDNNVTSKTNRVYNDNDNPQSLITNSFGNNDSRNFKSNFRMEWKPDTLTTIIFRPSLAYGRNIRHERTYDELNNPMDTLINYDSESLGTSSGKSLNGNGRLFISRKLNDSGRILSLSLSGGVKDSDSYGKDWFDRVYNDPLSNDSIKDQIFEQDDKTHNWRINASYVEPLGRNNFLQLSYTVRQNYSKTNKIANNNIGSAAFPDYSDIDTLYTRNVENDFLNQNITLSFKSIRQKFNYTIGLGLEPSSSKTTIEQPLKEDLATPRKNFLSFAPNMIFNYLWDKRHNLRMTYQGETNQPTTLQLFNGITSSNGTNTVYGNPDLRPNFVNRFVLRYQKFNPVNASFMMFFVRFNQTMNDIVSTSNRTIGNERETRYTNINGNFDGNLRFVMNSPLKFNKKFSVSSMTFASYSRNNTFINSKKNRANISRIVESAGLQYRSDKLDFNIRGNISYNKMKNSNGVNNQNTYTYGGFGSATWYLPFNFVLDSDVNYSANSGYSDGFSKNEWLWNASASKQIFKNKAGTIRFKIYDILKQQSNITRNNAALYVEDVTTNALNSYFMVHFIYKFQFFKGGAKMGDMAPRESGGRGHGGGRRSPH